MAEKKYSGAPFGTQTARFDVSGVHPKSKTPGTFTEIPYDKKFTQDLKRRLGPGSYDVDQGGFSTKSVEEKTRGPGWARAYEVERMAALPHLLHKEQWEQKRMLQRKLGPGSYEIKDFLQSSDEKPRSSHGICETKAPRFKDGTVSDIPGPGTYGNGGIPHAAVEEKDKRSTSTKGMLDAGSSTPRNLPTVGSVLGPGTYNFKSFTEQMGSKVTSTRGPYDLFSGDRNKPITVGYLAAPIYSDTVDMPLIERHGYVVGIYPDYLPLLKLADLGPGQYDLKSFLSDWDTIHRKRQGKFGKVSQYPGTPTERIFCSTLSQCQKQENTPGPGSYDPMSVVKAASTNSPGFLSSAQRNDRVSQRFFTRNFNPVGAGRYDIQKWEEAQHRNGHGSVFKSRTGKLSAGMEKFLKERIRAKDVPLDDRVFIVPPEAPGNSQSRYTNKRATTVA